MGACLSGLHSMLRHRLGSFAQIRKSSSVNSKPYNPRDVSYGNTIYALATPKGRAGIAVIRVSGTAVTDISQKMIQSKRPSLQHSMMRYCKIFDPRDGELIDKGMCVLFKGYTSAPTSSKLCSNLM